MIKSVKVSLSAVKPFEQAVKAIRNYTPKFDKGICCIADLRKHLSEGMSVLREATASMKSAQVKLAPKIREIKAKIAKLTARLSELNNERSALESELSGTPESLIMINKEGESYEVPNPAYIAISVQIESVEAQISTVETELLSHQQRLEHANSVDGQITQQINTINDAIYALKEKQNSCSQLSTELEEIRNSNLRKGASAYDSLNKIEEIISRYLNIKMIYENVSAFNNTVSSSGINININIHKSSVVEQQTIIQDSVDDEPSISNEEIEKHGIRFDDNGRICLYDNKTFGGKYNSYEDRLLRTCFEDNPVLGDYEGERGESKFIPSGRTADGVSVIEILKQYGLDGIEYRNAEPDFEVCSEATVKIKRMTENRENYSDPNGIPVFGNYVQADIECAKLWNIQNRDGRSDWNGRDVFNYRKANKLTWHEKCDMETMVLVRTEINAYFRHSGGCSECRMRDTGQNGGGFDE